MSTTGKYDKSRISEAKDSLDLPKRKVWTKQEFSARIIQTKFRQHLAKTELDKRKQNKKKYEEEMERLKQSAFNKIVRSEHERSEKEKKAQRKIIAQKEKNRTRMKRMISASFDGDNEDISLILEEIKDEDDKSGMGFDVIGKNLRERHQLAVIDCKDPHGYTPLSEAAAGGQVDTIRLLLNKGADPNTQGHYMRTPLYRAAFAGHTDVCKVLLENGADPRMYAMDNNTPKHISTIPSVVELMKNWDVKETEKLIKDFDNRQEQLREEDRARKEAAIKIVQEEVEKQKTEYDNLQFKLNNAHCEMEKKVYEEEHKMSIGFNRKQITLQRIQELRFEIEGLKVKIEKSGEQLTDIKLKLTSMEADGDGLIQQLPGLHIMVKEINRIILKDDEIKLKASGKWPLVIDDTNQAATYLKYKDTVYLNALDTKKMDNEHIRKSVVVAIRYGKPLVLDMMEVDMFTRCKEKFDHVMEGLLDLVMNKTILHEENYMKLVKDSDGPDFERNKFTRVEHFKLIIVTKNQHPSSYLIDNTFVIRILVPLA